MIINLPHIDPIDTLKLPENFEERVSYSFCKFTEMTARDYLDNDKLKYIDNLRKVYTGRKEASDRIAELVGSKVMYELSENDSYPDEDEFRSFDFMCECYEEGRDESDFSKNDYERCHRDNDRTLQVIAKIIKIVIEWTYETMNDI